MPAGNSTERRMTIMQSSCLVAFLATMMATSVNAFSSPVFQEQRIMQKTAPSKLEGVEIELPDFDELFDRIQQVSPLTKSAIEGRTGGFVEADANDCSGLEWTNIESNKRKLVHQIDKIDDFQGLGSPIVRFRSSMKGPCSGIRFAHYIMDCQERGKWDPQIGQVEEKYPIVDLDTANICMGFGKYGDCSRLGIGYCQTKGTMGVTSREQLTMCGIQDFASTGSTVIWGTEMEDWHNHLLPEGPRHTRAKSHIFCTTLVPTSEDSFDVEYVLQLEIGGKIPIWMTTPIITETVKNLFRHAQKDFDSHGKGGEFDKFVAENERQRNAFIDRHSILMTP
jgi:hypothetical protein